MSVVFRSNPWGCAVANKKTAEPKKLAITQVRSRIGRPGKHRRTLDALGLKRHQQTVIHNDTPAIRGMIDQISHMLRVTDVEE
jgi:large subunit ribosomal protein L30